MDGAVDEYHSTEPEEEYYSCDDQETDGEEEAEGGHSPSFSTSPVFDALVDFESSKRSSASTVEQFHPIFLALPDILPAIEEEVEGEEEKDRCLWPRNDSEGEDDGEPEDSGDEIYPYDDIANWPRFLEIEEVPSFRWLSDSFRRISLSSCSTGSLSTRSCSISEKGGTEKVELLFPMPMLLVGMIQKTSVEVDDDFQDERSKVGHLVDEMAKNLRSISCLVTSHRLLCARLGLNILHISNRCSRPLERTLALSIRCRRSGGNLLLRRLTFVRHPDFQKVLSQLEAAVHEMEWLVSVISTIITHMRPNTDLSVPRVPKTDPLNFWFGNQPINFLVNEIGNLSLSVHVRAINFLATLAREGDDAPLVAAINFLIRLGDIVDKNKDIIVRWGVAPALACLLTRANPSIEVQLAAVDALKRVVSCTYCHCGDVLRHLVSKITDLLSHSPSKLHIHLLSLLDIISSKLDSLFDSGTEELIRENVIYTLMMFLSRSIVASTIDIVNCYRNDAIPSSDQENHPECFLCAKILCRIVKSRISPGLVVDQVLFIMEDEENPTKLRIHATCVIMYLLANYQNVVDDPLADAVAPLVLQLHDENPEVVGSTAYTLIAFLGNDNLHLRVREEFLRHNGIGMMKRLVQSSRDEVRSVGVELLAALNISYPPDILLTESYDTLRKINSLGKSEHNDDVLLFSCRARIIRNTYMFGCFADLLPSEELHGAIHLLVELLKEKYGYGVRKAATTSLYFLAERAGLELDIHEAIMQMDGAEMLVNLSRLGTYESKLLLSLLSDLLT